MAVATITYTQIKLGQSVIRATSNIPQTATVTIFTVTGGRVLITALVGQVTTVIQAQANAMKVLSTPTVGSAVDLCATADVNGLEVGGLLSVDGVAATALIKANAGAVALMTKNVLVPIGNIGVNTAASSTGQIQWTIYYMPFDLGASVAAA